MSNRDNKFNMSRTLTTNLLFSYLYTASVTYNTFITNTLILAAGTFIITGRTENALTEKAIPLRFVRAVVNGLDFFYFTI